MFLFVLCVWVCVCETSDLCFHVFGAYSLVPGDSQAKENCSDIIKGAIGHKNKTQLINKWLDTL